MNETVNPAILWQVNKLKNLPALPEASLKILSAINNPTISPDDLAKVLGLSPGLVARLLGLANAAYFGQSRKINDLSTAIYQVLGLDLVKSLALSIILNVQFDASQCQAFNSQYFWQRSLITAVAGQKLAQANQLPNYSPATVYTSGLLLQLGLLMLAYLMPNDLNKLLQEAKQSSVSLTEIISTQFGCSQYQLAYLLMHKWHLSPIYQNVQQNFDNADYNGEEKKLIDLLQISQFLSGMLMTDKLELNPLITRCEQRAVTSIALPDIIDYLTEHRKNIENLADIIGN